MDRTLTPTDHPLALHQELLLLMLRNKRGDLVPGVVEAQSLAGAILAELMLLNRVGADARKRALVLDPTPTGDPLLNECLAKLDGATRPHAFTHWVERLAGTHDLEARVADQLVRLGILGREHDRVLFIFPRTRYPEIDHAAEAAVLARLRAAVFAGGEVDDARTAMLVSLTHASGLLPMLFDRRDVARRRPRIEAIARGDLVGSATRIAIRSAQDAILTVVIAAASA